MKCRDDFLECKDDVFECGDDIGNVLVHFSAADIFGAVARDGDNLVADFCARLRPREAKRVEESSQNPAFPVIRTERAAEVRALTVEVRTLIREFGNSFRRVAAAFASAAGGLQGEVVRRVTCLER